MKPIIKKKTPDILNLFSGVVSINFSIFFIFYGNNVTNMPSINKSNPIAITKSFIKSIVF